MHLIGKKILIIDDEPLFLETTKQLLSKEGAECETAEDAPSALAVLQSRDFDLILTDLNMPGNLRWELLHAGRRRWSHVPMIVITGVPTLPSAIESLRLGVTDYLLKPVGFPQLLSSIQRALDSSESATASESNPQLGSVSDPEAPFQQRRAESEKQFLIELMQSSNGNVTQASKRANMSRQGFHKLLKRHNLSASDFREKVDDSQLN
jgi:DNA-binding NtrC family response regulator